MKKIITNLFLICFATSLATSQETQEFIPTIFKKHEIKLGTVKLLSTGIFESSYEYVKDSNKGFGATLLINFNTGNEYPENYSLSPFFRMYFQTNEDYGAKGFFVEAFTSFFGGVNHHTFNDEESFFDTSIGFGLGKKWINTSGFVFEIKFGAGRNLLNGSEYDALVKGDLYIGYRF